jgi:hypothetical protein
VDFGSLDTVIVCSNPTQGIDICPRLSVLCRPVDIEAFRLADPPSGESY